MIYMITDTKFLRGIMPVFRTHYLETSYAKIVSEWVVEYFERYQEAPGKNIQDIYKAKKGSIRDEDDTHNVSSFLAGMSKDWENQKPNNVPFSLAQAIEYLKLRSQTILNEDLEEALRVGDPTKGENVIANYQRVEMPSGEGVSLLNDTGEVISAFMDDDEDLFSFPGAVGELTGTLVRGDFLLYLGPMKRGKTWWLLYTAETAMSNGLKVVFITFEMTKKQLIRRSWRSIVGRPLKKQRVVLPHFEETDDDPPKFRIQKKEETREAFEVARIKEYQRDLKQMYRGGDIRVIALPSKSKTVADISTRLDNMSFYDHYDADVVVIDYGDLLLPTKGFRGEYRHTIDDVYAGMRRLAEERNVLVVTASQTEKSTFRQDVTRQHVAEDVRKIAYVTCGLALNQSEAEEEAGIMRVAQLVVREERRTHEQAVALQCLDIGRVCLASKLRKDVVIEEDEKKKKAGSKYRKRD